jgi:hypothetical protein
MLGLIRNHPIKISVALSVMLFAGGFAIERLHESSRIRTLVESTIAADKDIQNLVFAYDLRVNTVRSLAVYAKKHKVVVPYQVKHAFEDEMEKPDVTKTSELRQYLTDQFNLTSAAKEMITEMDAELPANDSEFQRLFKEFQSEEESIARIRGSYRALTERVRAVARKGDRQFLQPGLHVPAEERM